MIYVGTAGWAIPRESKPLFDSGDSQLQIYATRFNAVEINSSFYRPHRPGTYARWAASVPEHFRFAVKMPRSITHERRLKETDELLDTFLAQSRALGDRLGPILIQLPPSLKFDVRVACKFFDGLRDRFKGDVVCEPRHASWFTAEANAMLNDFHIARVAADPASVAGASEPGGWHGVIYFRLHGSPRIYYSNYDDEKLEMLAVRLRKAAKTDISVWCIFDNTAEGAATRNALALNERLA
ncbi:MAG TPA: DUF72 domain-containing protein [Rhizomicrobium sp.]|nr:DUF72 domain-containing protein [Rhizomicrobium sp.]